VNKAINIRARDLRARPILSAR